MKQIIFITLLSFTLLLYRETRLVIPIDKEFKSTLYNVSSPDMPPIITSYSTSLPINQFTYRLNHPKPNPNPNPDDNSTSPMPLINGGNFSFSSNPSSISIKPFALTYNTVHHFDESITAIEASLALNNDLNGNNFIHQLYTQNILQSTQFSFYYNEHLNTSQLFLGDFSTGTNISSIFNSLSYCQTQTSNWECQISSMKLKSQQYKIYSSMIIDTSSSIITLPLSDYKLLLKYYLGENNCILDTERNNQIKCKCTSASQYYSTDTNNNNSNNIKFILENREAFNLNPKYLIDYYPNDANYQCHWKLYVNKDDLSNWIIGRPGLVNSFYTFDLKTKRFGFIQDISHINSLPKDEIVISDDKGGNYTSKLGWGLTLFIVLMIMWAVYQFASTGSLFGGLKRKSSSLDVNDNEDRKNMLSLAERFKTEDDGEGNGNANQGKRKEELVEMKEMLIEKK